MASLEAQFQTACDAREIPGVILLSSDGKGSLDPPSITNSLPTNHSRHVRLRQSLRARHSHLAYVS